MIRIVLKILISAVLIAAISEIGKRSTLVGAIVGSLPLTSVLALTWLYVDTHDVEKVSALSTGIFWAVLPSFFFFLSLPWLLKHGVRFALAMPIACLIMAGGYAAYVALLKNFGVEL